MVYRWGWARGVARGVWGGVCFCSPYICTRLSPPGPPGLRGGVSCARGVRGVVCRVSGLRGVSLYTCTRLSPPPPLWRGVAGCGVPCGAVVGCCRIYAHGCHPPPEKGIKRAGRPCCRPAFVGCAYFWLLFMPPRLRMVASVSAISSGVYPAAANTAPSLSSSTAFVSIQ